MIVREAGPSDGISILSQLLQDQNALEPGNSLSDGWQPFATSDGQIDDLSLWSAQPYNLDFSSMLWSLDETSPFLSDSTGLPYQDSTVCVQMTTQMLVKSLGAHL